MVQFKKNVGERQNYFNFTDALLCDFYTLRHKHREEEGPSIKNEFTSEMPFYAL